MRDHLRALFDPQAGAYRYLSGYLDGSEGKVRLLPVEASPDGATLVFEDVARQVKVTAVPVEHGVVPALAYLVEIRGRTIVFAGDQNAMSQGFVDALAGRMAVRRAGEGVRQQAAGRRLAAAGRGVVEK